MRIEEVVLSDYENIVKLNQRNNLTSLKKNDWENIWNKNPFLLESKIPWKLGWKLINTENLLVGVILNIPFIFKYQGINYLAAVCNNYVIDKEFRSFSLKLRHLFLNQNEIDLYITNTANEKSQEIMEAFKAKKINQYDYQNRLVYILKKSKIFFKLLKNINLIFKKEFLEKVFKNKNKLAEDINFEIIRLDNSERFENLINNKNIFYSSKEIKWLKWKYNIYLERKDILIVKVLKKKEIEGFIFLIKNFHKGQNLKRLSIVEIIGFEKNSDYLEGGLMKCIEIGKKEQLDIIDVIGFKKFKRQIIKKVGFISKESINFLIKSDNSNLNKILFESNDISDLSVTDGDGIFYY